MIGLVANATPSNSAIGGRKTSLCYLERGGKYLILHRTKKANDENQDKWIGVGGRSPQAVGQALRRNPFAPEIPCHRVIAVDGSLGGFFGERSAEALAQKRALLEAEGVKFVGGAVVSSGGVGVVERSGSFDPLRL